MHLIRRPSGQAEVQADEHGVSGSADASSAAASTAPRPGSACVATIGNFDGVHCGHQAMFAAVREAATRLDLPSTVISFEPLPHEFFAGSEAPMRLQGLRDRVQSIAANGIQQMMLLPFDRALANQDARDFIAATLQRTLGVQHLVVGDDFRFGHRREGTVAMLRELGNTHGFTVEQSPTITDSTSGERISSTRIREHLQQAELAAAARLLGRPYRISGRVVHGEKVGRQLGFPTANVSLGSHRPPLRGVFMVRVQLADGGYANARGVDGAAENAGADSGDGAADTTGVSGFGDRDAGVGSGGIEPWYGVGSGGIEPWYGVANLGERPTVGGRKLLLEVHLLDRSDMLYGHHLCVDFVEFIRGEQRFDSLDDLKARIALDVTTARASFAALVNR